MQIDTTAGPDAHRLAKERDEARRLLKDLLLSSFNGMSAWARTNACVALEHPARSERYSGCPCGKRPS
jgi:hypothetical protein